MKEDDVDFLTLCDYLEYVAKKTNAGCARMDFTRANGDVFRIEYKRSNKM